MPTAQYLAASRVNTAMAQFGRSRVDDLTLPRILVLAVLGGGFITAGALLSVLLSQGIEAAGPSKAMQGFAFSIGFFFVVLSEAILFTEANVVLPTTLLEDRRRWLRVLRLWVLAWLGNLAGAWLFGNLIGVAQLYPAETLAGLQQIVDGKLAYRELGGAGSWGRLVLSGVLANWLVGMAAFFALHIAHGGALSWDVALVWSIIPAGIGNMIGAAVLVALPFWFVHPPSTPERQST